MMSPDDGVTEEDFSTVRATPNREVYEWGEIGFRFYDGWLEDVRSCAHGLRNRVNAEGHKCNPAERLMASIESIHYENKSPLHRFFEFLSTGDYSALDRKDALRNVMTEEKIMEAAMELSRHTQWPPDACVRALREANAWAIADRIERTISANQNQTA